MENGFAPSTKEGEIKNPVQFGAYLKQRRKQLNHTQSFLSEVSGLSVSFISDVENGKPTVEPGKVLLLSSLPGLDVAPEERE